MPKKTELKFTKENLKMVDNKLKHALVEFYHKLKLLKSYRFISTNRLRRLSHIFEKVVELPLSSRTDVDVQPFTQSFRFSAAADGLGVEIRAEAIEIYPGYTKVVIRGESEDDVYDGLEIDRWRFRLPECTRPEMASAECVGGMLV
ncbi:hypothetical protein QQ045_009745 [Rhodiola kirilowii]